MKFMNMKRFGSIAMAGAMALSLTAPAFATSNTTTTITGSYEEIPIAVVVPTTGSAQINPYGLPVTLTKSDEKTVNLVGQQITSMPLSIKNQGTVKLDVDASLAVIPSGDVVIAPSAGTDKTIAVSLEVIGMDDAALAVAPDSEKLEDLLIDKFASDATWDSAVSLAAPAAANGATTVTPAKSTDSGNTSPMAILGAVTPRADSYVYGAKSIALFRLTGELAAEPVDSGTDAPWTEDDGFSATVVFKFTPHADVAASVSLDNSTLNVANGGTGTLTASFDAGDSELTVASWAWATSAPLVAGTTNNDSNTATVAWVAAGSATITVTATLSDGSTVTATCAVTCAA